MYQPQQREPDQATVVLSEAAELTAQLALHII
jgi:hypothetical protein